MGRGGWGSRPTRYLLPPTPAGCAHRRRCRNNPHHGSLHAPRRQQLRGGSVWFRCRYKLGSSQYWTSRSKVEERLAEASYSLHAVKDTRYRRDGVFLRALSMRLPALFGGGNPIRLVAIW